jgi:transcriptional regulator with XRE-family HTH domain
MTQEQLAAETGVTQTAISRYEKGKVLPDLSSLLRLATGLRTALEPLVEGVDVRFDLMYQGLQATITTEAVGTEDASAEALPLDAIIPGAPTGGTSDEPASAQNMAEAHAALTRVIAELVSVAGRFAPGPPPVARNLGPEIRPRAAQHRKGAHRGPKKTPPTKRR